MTRWRHLVPSLYTGANLTLSTPPLHARPFPCYSTYTMYQLHCIISGRVQGVAYRAFVQNIARDMRVNGFVVNLPDGSVEVLAQGEYGVLKVFLQHIAKGPAGAVVTGVYDEWSEEPEKTYERFDIL